MKNKKNIVIIVVIIFVIVSALISFIYFGKIKNQNISDKNININLEDLDKNLTKVGVFEESKNTDIDKVIAVDTFNIQENDIVEVIGKMPILNIKASMYIVVKVQDGKQEIVKQKLEEYTVEYEKQWSNYLEDQYTLVKNKEIGIKGQYIYLIIADNAIDLKKLIK